MPANQTEWSHLRLKDCLRPGLRVLFVGINPGVRSATTGHHFAGFSNRFWKLLWESGLVPEPISSVDDRRLLEWGYGVTNLVARPSPGIDDLHPREYVAGWKVLERKVRRFRPPLIALVGVTLYRAILPLVVDRQHPDLQNRRPVTGLAALTVHDARFYVLPNPSGRNANFSYAEMLAAFRGLKREVDRLTPARLR